MLEPYCFGCFSIIPLLFFMESLVVCNCVKPLLLLIYIYLLGGGGWFHECCKVYFTKLIFRST